MKKSLRFINILLTVTYLICDRTLWMSSHNTTKTLTIGLKVSASGGILRTLFVSAITASVTKIGKRTLH